MLGLTPFEMAYGSFFLATAIVVGSCLGMLFYVKRQEKAQ